MIRPGLPAPPSEVRRHMIPASVADLDRVIAAVRQQSDEVTELFETATPESLTWRPSPTAWSVAGHVFHMVKVNGPYMAAAEACAERERASGRRSDGPYRHGWLGPWFANSMRPPPKRRFKTLKAMVPDPQTTGGEALKEFLAAQDVLVNTLEGVRGLDLGRARFSSPFMAILRLSLGAGLAMLVLHNQRHIWLSREVMSLPEFPTG